MKVCFIGAGSIGKRHMRNLVNILSKMGIDCEIHLLRSTEVVLEDSISKLVSKEVRSISDLDVSYDAIFITNPTYRHYDTIVKTLNKSNFFFIEKPVFEKSNIDVSFLLNENKNFYIACPLRYTKVLSLAKEVVQCEKVFSARAISSSFLPEWRPNVDYRNTYSANRMQGGGVKIDIIHEWDYLVDLFGFPISVFCMEGKFSELEIDCEDLAAYIAKYQDKIVELHLDYFGRKMRRNLEIRTTKYEYVFDLIENCVWKNGELYCVFDEEVNQKYLNEMAYFVNFLSGKKGNVNDLNHALKVLRLAEQY